MGPRAVVAFEVRWQLGDEFSPVTPAALANQTAGEQDGHGRVHGTHPFCRGQLRVAGTTHRPYCAIAAGEWLYPQETLTMATKRAHHYRTSGRLMVAYRL